MSNTKQNIYGDDLSKGINGHGVDIASQRIDDLDRKVFEYISGKAAPSILDIGCGAGGQSFRMVNMGARVTAIDQYDLSKIFDDFRTRNRFDLQSINFIQGDLRFIGRLVGDKLYNAGYSQRTLHYLRYGEAVKFLEDLRRIIKEKLFISVSGITSELRDSYPVLTAIKDRFFKLSSKMSDKHQIHEPVCLYSQEEIVALLQKTGWNVIESWLSEFGNVKCICSRD